MFRQLAVATVVAAVGRSQTSYEVVFESNVEMKTRDGVTLRADIYRPKADGKFPVLLNRNPYDKYIYLTDALASAARGYVFIVQDARGRFASDGDWYPFKYESQDTYDTVEWAAALPYSNGKVGMVGISYVGVPQLLGAIAAPPHLVAIYPGITASDFHENWIYHGGALSQAFAQGWSGYFTNQELSRRASKAAGPSPAELLTLPPARHAAVESFTAKNLAEYYRDWIAHPRFDDYWKQWSIEQHYDQIKIPALHLGAWYDIFMPGALRNYIGVKTRGGSDAARKGQRLVVIPGGHAGFSQRIGAVDFGRDSLFDVWAYGLRWFDWVLKGIDNGMANEKPVRLFIMGRNVWRDEDDWPLARALSTRFYLHSTGRANTLIGDGALSTTAAAVAEPADTYVHDPGNPAPTYGGVIASPEGITAGPQDQRAIEGRLDILVYTTAAFEKDTEVTGPISLELYVSSSAVDTDFTGKLIDVWPNGFAQNLTEGILRARYRNSMEKAELMNPGQVYRLTIDLGATANVFLAGHKLRLEVASANFPRFDRNPNTGAEPETSTTYAKATNIIYHDHDHPSALVLPVVP
jgi:putative CocE/NonD family hydrolase